MLREACTNNAPAYRRLYTCVCIYTHPVCGCFAQGMRNCLFPFCICTWRKSLYAAGCCGGKNSVSCFQTFPTSKTVLFWVYNAEIIARSKTDTDKSAFSLKALYRRVTDRFKYFKQETASKILTNFVLNFAPKTNRDGLCCFLCFDLYFFLSFFSHSDYFSCSIS
jgi:hypothetical protein